MAIRKFRSGQSPYPVETYVGTAGTIFYDEANGALRISDGVTPGGSLISYPVASSTQLGGIKLGPGVVLNNDDQIIIDSEGLDFSFGHLAATVGTYTNEEEYAVLSSINLNEDIVLASNGTGSIEIVGELHVHATNGTLTETLEREAAFLVKADGQVRMLVPGVDSTEGAVSIVGSSTGAFVSPVNTGVMLHITGQYDTPAIPSRLYNDAQGSFAAFVARRFNGTVASPTAVLADEEIMRISGTAHNGTVIPGTGNQRIVYKALGNQTTSNQGGYMELWATPLNSTTIAKVATINNADGITATKFTGPLTGNASTVTNGVYTTDTATVTNTMLAGSIANAKLANSTISGVALGSNLAALSAGNYLTGTDYTGATARTFAVDATTAATASKVVARDADADVYARRFVGKQIHAVRDAGNPGGTLTLDFATDEIVVATLTADVTLAYSNLLAGSEVTLILQKTGGGTDQVNVALNEINIAPPSLPGTDNNFDFAEGECCIIRFISTGTTTGALYASIAYDQF
jgi:hypothetical protein